MVRQSERGAAYDEAIARLETQGQVFECYCTRREILEAPSAPHAPPGAYPGTCRDLTHAAREQGPAADEGAAARTRSPTAHRGGVMAGRTICGRER